MRRGLAWRMTWISVGLVGIALVWPVGFLLAPRVERPALAWGGALAVAVVLALLVRDVVALRRATRARHEGPPPRLDEVWDQAAADEEVWDSARDMGRWTSASGWIPTRPGDASHSEGISGVLTRLDAKPVSEVHEQRVMGALERATLAVGVGFVPAACVVESAQALNAFVACESGAIAVVLSRPMIDTFEDDELMAVFANLLVRTTEDAAFAFDRGFLTRKLSDEGLFSAATRLYTASDRRTVLAMRDAGPLASALMKTSTVEVWIPGATTYDAFAAWTWPARSPALSPADPFTFATMAVDVALGRDLEDMPRVETLRLAELEKVADIGA